MRNTSLKVNNNNNTKKQPVKQIGVKMRTGKEQLNVRNNIFQINAAEQIFGGYGKNYRNFMH